MLSWEPNVLHHPAAANGPHRRGFEALPTGSAAKPADGGRFDRMAGRWRQPGSLPRVGKARFW